MAERNSEQSLMPHFQLHESSNQEIDEAREKTKGIRATLCANTLRDLNIEINQEIES